MRKYGFVLFLLLSISIVTLSGCGGGGGGQTAAANGSVVTSQGVIGPGPECTYGGVAIEVGIDENGNGVLDSPDEVDSTEYVCNGADGAAGVNALVNITSEAPGSNCGNGGFRVDVGADSNANTILDAGEITATDYICNGTAVVITDIDPSSARIGDEVTIRGAGFGSVQGTLTVGGVDAFSITSWSDNVIIAAVPGRATTGLVTVSVDGVVSNPVDLVILWTLSNPDNVAIASTTDHQLRPKITTDGSGGAIMVWEDYRATNGLDIYAQRVDSTGAVLWATDGIGVSVTSGIHRNPAITSDGSGGAIIAWEDNRSGNYDIYAQKLSASGAAQWTANGVAIIKAASFQDKVEIISDGSGGAIMVWEDYRDGATNGYDIYAQRVDRSGSPSWTKNGVSVTNAVNSQNLPKIVSDGSGGAIITWEDQRNSGTTNIDIYAQKILSTGELAWPINGIIICNGILNQRDPELTSDGAGGAYIVWQDYRGGTISDVIFNHVDTGGVKTFGDLGHYVKEVASLNQRDPVITSDGSGGAIIAWTDYVNTPTLSAYAQKVNASYAFPLRWAANGVEIHSDTLGVSSFPEITGDGNGGAIVVWSGYDIIGQKVDHRGVIQWGPNGVGITTAWNNTGNKQIISDGSGGAIVVWEDYRLDFGSDPNIFAQGVSADGY